MATYADAIIRLMEYCKRSTRGNQSARLILAVRIGWVDHAKDSE